MNSAANKVFSCDHLRREILSFFPTRCRNCKKILRIITFPNPEYAAQVCFAWPYFFCEWNEAQCHKNKRICNLCYHSLNNFLKDRL